MSALECLACKHDNKVGDKFCEACGSSLDLKFCPGCEAINGRTATHCRSCAAELPAEAAAEAPAEAPAEPSFHAPQRWRAIEPEYSGGKRLALWTARFFGGLSLVALGAFAYHVYGQWPPTMKAVAAAPTVAAPVTPTPAVAIAAPPKRSATGASGERPAEPPTPKRSVAEVKQAPKATATKQGLPGVESRSPAPAVPAASAASAEQRAEAPTPKRSVADVKEAPKAALANRTITHTQSTGAASPVVSTEFKQAPPEALSHGRITHTRPGPDAVPVEPRQAAVIPTTTDAPAAPAKAASSACPEAAAVLGLCSANVKGERN
jgi:ribosomal protein L40E